MQQNEGMSTLDSASTLAEIHASYDDSASWEEDGDAAKAAAFVTACRFILRLAVKESQGGKSQTAEMEFDFESIRNEMAEARKYIGQQSAGSSSNPNVVHSDWGGLRV